MIRIWSALGYLPPNHAEERRHRLVLFALVRGRRLLAMLFRLLLVAVVLELFLANGLLDFFGGQDGGRLALRASAPCLAAGPPRRSAPPLLK